MSFRRRYLDRSSLSSNGGPIYFNGTGGANNYPLRGGKVKHSELVGSGFLHHMLIFSIPLLFLFIIRDPIGKVGPYSA